MSHQFGRNRARRFFEKEKQPLRPGIWKQVKIRGCEILWEGPRQERKNATRLG
jgi:hypothetical protein